MISFIGRLSALCLSLCFVVILLLVTGQTQSTLTTAAIHGIGGCEQPCWAGIEPGHTRFDQVTTLLAQHDPSLSSIRMQLSSEPSYEIQGATLSANVGSSGGMVGYISVKSAFPIWRLLLLLDRPDCVRPQGNLLIEIIWEFDDVTISASAPQHPELIASAVTLWQPEKSPCSGESIRRLWTGYGTLERLIRLGTAA
jgi:hypothetical protein